MTADPAATAAGPRTQPGPRISQSASRPGCGSPYDAAPIGIQRDATLAATTPSVAPAAAARNGGAAADATAWRGVMPTACRTCRSATLAEVYLATDWPTRNIAATSAATAKASRQAASYSVRRSTGPPKYARLSSTSMSDRPVTRARSARNAGIAALPPLSRTNALMYPCPLVPRISAR